MLRDPRGEDLAVTLPTPVEIVGGDGEVLFGAEFLAEGGVRLTSHRVAPEHACESATPPAAGS